MGILDVPGISRAQGDARYARATPYTGIVASRAGCYSAVISGSFQIMGRSKHVAMDDISRLQLGFGNFYVALPSPFERTPGATSQFTASIEYPIGTIAAVVKFSGATLGSVADGALLISDAASVSIPRGAAFYVRVWHANPNGVLSNLEAGLNNVTAAVPNSGEWVVWGVTTPDLTQSTSNSNNQIVGRHLRPTVILGSTSRPTFFLAGDSRLGQGVTYDSIPNSYGGRGEVERSVGKRFGTFNAGCSSEKLADVLAGNYSKRMQFAQYCSHVICEYGINDINAGTSFFSMVTNLATFASSFGGKPFYQTTITPATTSTDSWTTTTNQAISDPVTNQTRTRYNDAIRLGLATPVTGCIEVADQVETARNSGIWKASGRTVTDAAISAGTATLTSATASFTNADNGRSVSIAGAGTAGAALVTSISSVTNATTVVLLANAVTTVSGATASLGTFGFTKDGLHGSSDGFALIEASTAFQALG